MKIELNDKEVRSIVELHVRKMFIVADDLDVRVSGHNYSGLSADVIIEPKAEKEEA